MIYLEKLWRSMPRDVQRKTSLHDLKRTVDAYNTEMQTGIELIAAERERQITAEGWSAAHDDEHAEGEIAQAAAIYCNVSVCVAAGDHPDVVKDQIVNYEGCAPGWPWEWEDLKISPDPVRNLVKAGALIAAEIDRLQRATAARCPDCGEKVPTIFEHVDGCPQDGENASLSHGDGSATPPTL